MPKPCINRGVASERKGEERDRKRDIKKERKKERKKDGEGGRGEKVAI